MDKKVNILLMGVTGSGKSSVVNLLANKEVTETGSGGLSVTTTMERHSIKCDDLTMEITDTGTDFSDFITHTQTVNPSYNLVLYVLSQGPASGGWRAQMDFIKQTLGKDIPILAVINNCENQNPMNTWGEQNRKFLSNCFGPHSVCITALEHSDYLNLEEKRKESRCLLIDSIKKLSDKSYPFRHNLIYPNRKVYLKHKTTGLYMRKSKYDWGYPYVSIDSSPQEFLLNTNNTYCEFLPANYNQALTIEDGEGNAIYEPPAPLHVSYEKKNSRSDRHNWIIQKANNDDFLHGGSEVMICNQKWQNSYLSESTDHCVRGSGNSDIWIIIPA